MDQTWLSYRVKPFSVEYEDEKKCYYKAAELMEATYPKLGTHFCYGYFTIILCKYNISPR